MPEPAGENVAGLALLKQVVRLGETFIGAVKTHGTVAYASRPGVAKMNTSPLDDKASPLKAVLTATNAGPRLGRRGCTVTAFRSARF